MAEKINIGQNIKAILDILDWSQTDLAEKLNVTQPTISKWLDGEIDDEKLKNISTALEVSVEFIKKLNIAKLQGTKLVNNFSADVHSKNVGIIESYTDGNIDEFIVLEKEKQILLIEGHIGQLRILRKMNNSDVEDVKEIDAQIEENRKKIEALQNDILRYRDSK